MLFIIFTYQERCFTYYEKIMKFQLDSLLEEYEYINQTLFHPETITNKSLIKELASRKKYLEGIIPLYKQYKQTYEAYYEAIHILNEEKDETIKEIAKQQKQETESMIESLESQLLQNLIEKDIDDEKSIIIEMRAATWWDESSLFCFELAKAYINYAQEKWFKVEIIEHTPTEVGGSKEIIFEITGKEAFLTFKHEAGVHRVQRIPQTESKGRIHTSTITVAVMPKVEEVDIEIKEEDLEIKACRATGAWGQHVNKTDSAIHITHLPTGISVFCQEWRSQHKNKEKALSILRSKLYLLEKEKKEREINSLRFRQIGSWERAEKIRTYNFPQDRVTDHRIGQNFSWIEAIMQGKLQPIIDALLIHEKNEKMKEALEKLEKKN